MIGIVQLGEFPDRSELGLALEMALGAVLRVASTPLEAAALLSEGRPQVIVLAARCAWALELIEALEPRARPAVIVVGARTARAVGLADQWLPLDAAPAVVRQRVHRALGRANTRSLRAGAGFIDAATGLPNRRALLRALLRTVERAHRGGGKVSLVFINLRPVAPDLLHLDDAGAATRACLQEAAAMLQRRVRRTEFAGRLRRRAFGIIVHGDRRAAAAAATRFEAILAAKGIAAVSAAFEVDPSKPAASLVRRHSASHNRSVGRARFEPGTSRRAVGAEV